MRRTERSTLGYLIVVMLFIYSFTYLLLLNPNLYINGWKLSHKDISPFLTLTYVHGGDDARLKHYEAMEFCRNLLQHVEKLNETNYGNLNTTIFTNLNQSRSNSKIHSDLISLHDAAMLHELMGWILTVEPRQFWIGGVIKLIRDEFRDRREHLIQLWTDRTPANFRYIHTINPELNEMNIGDVKCLSVDYESGKWGVHDCERSMYFVCETIKLPKSFNKNSGQTTETVQTTLTPTMTTIHV